MSALQEFFNAERLRRGWSMREAARWSQISLSKAYAIANGDDNVEFETFENIAAAFNMSPAELAVAMGKGNTASDPDDVEALALFRQIPVEQKTAAKSMLRGLVTSLTRGPANGRRDATANRLKAKAAELDRGRREQDHGGPNASLPNNYRHAAAFWPAHLERRASVATR